MVAPGDYEEPLFFEEKFTGRLDDLLRGIELGNLPKVLVPRKAGYKFTLSPGSNLGSEKEERIKHSCFYLTSSGRERIKRLGFSVTFTSEEGKDYSAAIKTGLRKYGGSCSLNLESQLTANDDGFRREQRRIALRLSRKGRFGSIEIRAYNCRPGEISLSRAIHASSSSSSSSAPEYLLLDQKYAELLSELSVTHKKIGQKGMEEKIISGPMYYLFWEAPKNLRNLPWETQCRAFDWLRANENQFLLTSESPSGAQFSVSFSTSYQKPDTWKISTYQTNSCLSLLRSKMNHFYEMLSFLSDLGLEFNQDQWKISWPNPNYSEESEQSSLVA
jgi:hypothetical protein